MPYILLVEDDTDLVEVTADTLRDHGCEVSIAMNGLAGLHSLVRRPADLVLLDIMLPIISGLEMLQEVRADPAMREIPVVLVTAMRELVPPDGPDALHDAVLPKPFLRDDLLRVVDRFATGRRGG